MVLLALLADPPPLSRVEAVAMTYPLASESDLLEMLAEVNHELERMDSADVVNFERWENRRLTLLDSREAILADLARVRAAA